MKRLLPLTGILPIAFFCGFAVLAKEGNNPIVQIADVCIGIVGTYILFRIHLAAEKIADLADE